MLHVRRKSVNAEMPRPNPNYGSKLARGVGIDEPLDLTAILASALIVADWGVARQLLHG